MVVLMRREFDAVDLTPPAKDEIVLPLPRNASAPVWGLRVGIAALLAVVLGFLLRYDVALMRWKCDTIGDPDDLFRSLLGGFREVGEFFFVLVALILVATYDRRRWTIIAVVLFAELLAAVGANLGKAIVVRDRPEVFITEKKDDVQILDPDLGTWQPWRGVAFGDRDSETESFPSGHTAAAFAFMLSLAWFYPRLAWFCWTLAIGCGLSRYFDAVHWMSDCLVGAIIGGCAAWLALRPYVWVLPVIGYRRFMRRRQAVSNDAISPTGG